MPDYQKQVATPEEATLYMAQTLAKVQAEKANPNLQIVSAQLEPVYPSGPVDPAKGLPNEPIIAHIVKFDIT